MAGFFSHLVLDELYSIEFKTGRWRTKKSFGTAMKLWGGNNKSNLIAYSKLAVVGMGVVRSGERLYIVEDFGHALPSYSADEVKKRIADAVTDARRQSRQPDLQRQDQLVNDDAACSMAQADRLGTGAMRALAGRTTVLSYTSLHPETLPSGADRAIAGRNLKTFSIGACYARTATYPTGVYWVVLLLN